MGIHSSVLLLSSAKVRDKVERVSRFACGFGRLICSGQQSIVCRLLQALLTFGRQTRSSISFMLIIAELRLKLEEAKENDWHYCYCCWSGIYLLLLL